MICRKDIVMNVPLYRRGLFLAIVMVLANLSYGQGSSFSQSATITLTLPQDNQELYAAYPLFSWASTITIPNQDFYYQIKIVEVYTKQNPNSAVLNNPAVYQMDVGTATVYQYPVDAPELQKCKRYAWQVTAYSKKDIIVDEKSYKTIYSTKIAQSEAYVFTSQCTQNMRITSPTITKPYIILAKTVDNYVFSVTDAKLNFKYIEDYAAYNLKYKIYNWKREVLLSNTTEELLVDYGWNYLSIDLSEATTPLETGQIYQLEVETPKGDIYKAKFELKE